MNLSLFSFFHWLEQAVFQAVSQGVSETMSFVLLAVAAGSGMVGYWWRGNVKVGDCMIAIGKTAFQYKKYAELDRTPAVRVLSVSFS
jgi:hypothetical protein